MAELPVACQSLAHSCWARAFNDRHGVPGSHESAGIGSNRGRDHHHIRVPELNEINDLNASPNFATDHYSLSSPHIDCFMTPTYRSISSAQGRIHSSLTACMPCCVTCCVLVRRYASRLRPLRGCSRLEVWWDRLPPVRGAVGLLPP